MTSYSLLGFNIINTKAKSGFSGTEEYASSMLLAEGIRAVQQQPTYSARVSNDGGRTTSSVQCKA